MSRFTQYDKTSTYLENMSNAKLQRENRINSEIEEMKKDKIELDKIKSEIEYEEKLEKEKKALMKKKQYEEYMNYIKLKQNQIPEERNGINIKLGGEERSIKKQNYNEQMDNLCLNPTKNSNVYPQKQFINYSQAGRNYQRGYSHGYNILTGEIFSQPNQNQNSSIEEKQINKDYNKNEENEINKSNNKLKEEDYLAYMEFLRQKENKQNNLQENIYKSKQESTSQNEDIYNNININQNNTELNQDNITYKYNEYNEPPKKSYHIVPQQKENTYNPPNPPKPQINNNYPYHILDTSNTEYYLNKRKNMTSYEDIYKGKEYTINQNIKSDKEKKLEKQKEYARILEGQINSKNIYYETMRNLSKNSEPERDIYNFGNNLLFGGMNPYTKIKQRNNKLSDIPKDPYSNKNFNINSNNSYLSSNPIVNPGNNYQFNERIRSSERLQNNGNNIIDK